MKLTKQKLREMILQELSGVRGGGKAVTQKML